MELLLTVPITVPILNFIPDIAFVAARSWGVEFVHASLVPSFLSILVLAVAFFHTVALISLQEKGKQFFAYALVLLTSALLLTQGALWYGIFKSSGALIFAGILGGLIAYGGVWALLFVENKGNSFKIKLFLFVAFLYGCSGFLLSWWALLHVTYGNIAFGAQTLVFFAIGIMVLYIHKLKEKMSPTTL